uniref:c-type cytochrome n=1 Tax=Pararhizobium sp. IMCC3301 TaxID=3067904 RepID=UPI0027425A64|nr:c-type cytochrome [Pararhizobium sp. IMCC3301]
MNALIAALVCLVSISGSIASEGDVAYGAYLAAECVSCHRSGADADGPIPLIEGWDEAAFVAVMQSFRRRARDNVTMQTIAAALDDEQLAALAAYFAAQKTE